MQIVRVRITKNRAINTLALATANDLISQSNANSVLIQGNIFKRGSKETDSFLSRWVTVTPKCVSYAKFENTRVIDRIEMDEVIGIASNAIGDVNEDTGFESTYETTRGMIDDDLDASQYHAPALGVRNTVFWRFKLDMRAEKKNAFSYILPHRYCFALFTAAKGIYRGRVFVFQCENHESKEKWIETITRVLASRMEKKILSVTSLYIVQKRVRWFYVGDLAQILCCRSHFGQHTFMRVGVEGVSVGGSGIGQIPTHLRICVYVYIDCMRVHLGA